MNWDRIEANWRQNRTAARTRWSRLSDAQLDAIAGARARLVEKLQEVYGIDANAAEQEVRAWETIQGAARAH